MKQPKYLVSLAAGLFISAIGLPAVSAQVNIATVPVGNPRNSPDLATGNGQVNYSYEIGEYDVTSSQCTAFLNAVAKSDPYGIYNGLMSATSGGGPGMSKAVRRDRTPTASRLAGGITRSRM
jgi:sulfatase modifying factor 1